MEAVQRLITLALEEDIGHGDLTTKALVGPNQMGRARIVAKEPAILAGLDVSHRVFRRVNTALAFSSGCRDGDRLRVGQTVVEVEGSVRSLLTAERTALNFLQRLSGIATRVRRFADLVKSFPVRLVDTRKTTPGWRVLEKYAVRVGGGYNHRMGLYDGLLIKDNHIEACGGVAAAVQKMKKRASHLQKIEVEVCDLTGVQDALNAGADVIMLDNMEAQTIQKAVDLIDSRALVEASGGICEDDLVAVAKTGVDLISVGALTHGAGSVDLSMQIQNTF